MPLRKVSNLLNNGSESNVSKLSTSIDTLKKAMAQTRTRSGSKIVEMRTAVRPVFDRIVSGTTIDRHSMPMFASELPTIHY
ncbi:hypothetical protein BLOT_004810 [Blomia tropicalis]|nr:hypothetical protein BLOT_004810 [Blomia tropicalis]